MWVYSHPSIGILSIQFLCIFPALFYYMDIFLVWCLFIILFFVYLTFYNSLLYQTCKFLNSDTGIQIWLDCVIQHIHVGHMLMFLQHDQGVYWHWELRRTATVLTWFGININGSATDRKQKLFHVLKWGKAQVCMQAPYLHLQAETKIACHIIYIINAYR